MLKIDQSIIVISALSQNIPEEVAGRRQNNPVRLDQLLILADEGHIIQLTFSFK